MVAKSVSARYCRALALGAGVLCLLGLSTPASASDSGKSSVSQAEANVKQAQSHAHAADDALTVAKQSLAAAQAQVNAISTKVAQVQATIAADKARIAELGDEISRDRQALADFMRQSYKAGPNAGLGYVLAGGSVAEIMQRTAQEDRVRQRGTILVDQVKQKQSEVQVALANAESQATDLVVLQQQAATAAAVVIVDEENAAMVARAAHSSLSQSVNSLNNAEAAAAPPPPPPPKPSPPPVSGGGVGGNSPPPAAPGGPFTVDTDLTQPSGMTAAEINNFLTGTALAGLGQSYINAEQSYHVSARYLVAHSILESGWGTSAIARDKYNLFGFGANDANPYNDAKTFASFDACIQYVARFVASYYLSPSGRFSHGPTLRGMNVCYASDPVWAFKIARIASTIP